MIQKELLYDYMRHNKKIILIYTIVILIVFPIESVFLPQIYGKLFDSVKKNYQRLPNLFDNILINIKSKTSSGLIWKIIFLWCIVVLLHNFKNKYEGIISPSYLSFIRQKIFKKTLEKYSTNYTELQTGKTITRILDVSRTMKDIITTILSDLLPIAISVIGILIYLFYVSQRVAIIMLVGLIITLIIIFVFGKKGINKSASSEKFFLTMSEKLNDSFGNLMQVYINNETKKEMDKNNTIGNFYKESLQKQLIFISDFIGMLSIVSISTFIISLIIVYDQLKKNMIPSKIFISIVIILIYYLGYLMKISNHFPWFISKLGIVKNSQKFLENILHNTRDIDNNLRIVKGDILFKNVYFKYPKTDKYILENINVEFQSHKITGIIGQSGSGKSTLVKLLLKMNHIQGGEILIDGININKIDTNYLRDKIIYINQKTSLFNNTILDNILYGNNNLKERDVLKIIKKYNLESVYQELKNGIYENSGPNGSNLSLGMQKVTILLRGILRNGDIIIFDEPLAGLDSNTREKVLKMIKGECNNKTIVIITHDKEIIPYCHKVFNIKNIKKK